MILNWFDELVDFNVTIHHRPGVLNILPDHLSRLYPKENRQYYNESVRSTRLQQATSDQVDTADDGDRQVSSTTVIDPSRNSDEISSDEAQYGPMPELNGLALVTELS